MNSAITTLKELQKAPFRIQGMGAHKHGSNFETNVAYRSFEAAQAAADSQATNAINIKNGNRFIIYKALAVVGPKPIETPTETIMLDVI